MSERCDSHHYQYRCRHDAGHDGVHETTGDDGTRYTWPHAQAAEYTFEVTAWCSQNGARGCHVGGQHVAKTCADVLALHRESGICVVVSSERSQHANRVLAHERLEHLVDLWNMSGHWRAEGT